MNEASATRAVHAKIPAHSLYVWKICDQYTNGVPDAYYAGYCGKSLWIEYKLTKRKKPPKHIDVTPAGPGYSLSEKQFTWLCRHHAMGHQVAVVLIHYKPRNSVYYVLDNAKWLEPQKECDVLALSQKGLVEWIMQKTGGSGVKTAA